jgi:hypothetical protein
MENGSIWGHGAYIGPDFSAEYLHTMALGIRTSASSPTSQSSGAGYLNDPEALDAEVARTLKENLRCRIRHAVVHSGSGRFVPLAAAAMARLFCRSRSQWWALGWRLFTTGARHAMSFSQAHRFIESSAANRLRAFRTIMQSRRELASQTMDHGGTRIDEQETTR